MPYTFKGIVKI